MNTSATPQPVQRPVDDGQGTGSDSHSADRPRLGTIPRYLSAVMSQGLVSGFHFVLNLTLVKLLAVADFGIFALTFVFAIMASSVSNALASTPLCVFGPSAATPTERHNIESVLSTIMLFLLGTVAATGLMWSTYGGVTGVDPLIMLAATGFILSYLARQYTRSFGYSRFDVIAVLYADMVYVVCGSGIILALLSLGHSLNVLHVLSVLAIANTVAAGYELTRLAGPISVMRIEAAFAAYKPLWGKTRWALIGAVTTVVVSQAHSIIVSILKGPAAYAPLAAGFVIFGPVRVIFTTIQNVIKPEMSQAIASGNARGASHQTLMASGISLMAVTGLIGLTYFAWPLLDAWLYADKYSDAPMKTIVFLWAGITLISAAQNGPFAALQSLKEFRSLALATVYGSVLSLILVFIALTLYPIHLSILGIFMAELFVAVWVIKLASYFFGMRNSDETLTTKRTLDTRT